MQTYFAEIILPLAIRSTYTYRIPRELEEEVTVGKRVVVQFAKSKYYAGIVESIHTTPPGEFTAKYIEAVLDTEPIVLPLQLKFWQWLADYYVSGLGELFLAAVPSSLRMSSETLVFPIDISEEKVGQLTIEEINVYNALRTNESLTIEKVSEILGKKTVYPILKSMLQKEALYFQESLNSNYKEKAKPFIILSEEYQSEQNINKAFELVSRAAKQEDFLLGYLQLYNGKVENCDWQDKLILEKKLKSNGATVKALVEKGVFVQEEHTVERIPSKFDGERIDKIELSTAQTTSFNAIKAGWEKHNLCLLQGVTGSGKTEIYLELIKQVLKAGKQVLYLVPEIALTTQLIKRLKKHLGEQVEVFHSKYSPNERGEIWYKLLDKSNIQVVVGPRSALFLPYENLGLIIVDEEHETSYKQHDPAPRYQARDSALVLAKMHGAKVLWGSATPSIEAHWLCNNEQATRVILNERFGNIKLPEMVVADLKKETQQKSMHSHFSSLLLKEMEETLAKKEQIILFQNRRGFAPRWQCETCGWVPECHQCDVNLTYHKFKDLLLCHYCGFKQKTPSKCKACKGHDLKMLGFGTEKIEEELQILLPNAVIQRLDQDSTRKKNAYATIIEAFENKEIDILVGTQMVTKGLDFDSVGLVGVLSADQLLNYPDFRAQERAFQLMVQVAGRAGRKNKQGKVVIQTYQPEHPTIKQVVQTNYDEMAACELTDRQAFNYPPYSKLINITLKHTDKDLVRLTANYLAQQLKHTLGERVLGPEAPLIERVRNKYHQQILIKMERKISPAKVKQQLRKHLLEISLDTNYRKVRVVIDVEPY